MIDRAGTARMVGTLVYFLGLTACAPMGPEVVSRTPPPSGSYLSAVGPNVIPIKIRANTPLISLVVCVPQTSRCQKIDDIALDTGSTGLRIFKQALQLRFPKIQSKGRLLGQCEFFGAGIAVGPVVKAQITLGQEPTATLPVQVIDTTFGAPPPKPVRPNVCVSALRPRSLVPSLGQSQRRFLPYVKPDKVHRAYNGILGINPRAGDDEGLILCRKTCAMIQPFGHAGPKLNLGPQNPVAALAHDNNGVIVSIAPNENIHTGGRGGTLILGLDSEPNNRVSPRFRRFETDSHGELSGFLGRVENDVTVDTGSPTSGFDYQGIPVCVDGSATVDCEFAKDFVPLIVWGHNSDYGDPVLIPTQTEDSMSFVGTKMVINSSRLAEPHRGTSVIIGFPWFVGRSVVFVFGAKTFSGGRGPAVAF